MEGREGEGEGEGVRPILRHFMVILSCYGLSTAEVKCLFSIVTTSLRSQNLPVLYINKNRDIETLQLEC